MLHSRAPRMVSLSKLRSLSSDGAFTCIKLGCGNVFQTNAGRSTWTATNGYNLYYQITHYSWAIFWYSIHDLNKSFCPSCFSVNSCAIIFANFLSCCSEIRGHHVNVPHWRNLFFPDSSDTTWTHDKSHFHSLTQLFLHRLLFQQNLLESNIFAVAFHVGRQPVCRFRLNLVRKLLASCGKSTLKVFESIL